MLLSWPTDNHFIRHRLQPVLLPKPPAPPQQPIRTSAVTKTPMAIKVIKPSQQPTKFVVTSAASASAISGKKPGNPSAPIGTSQNPIQLIQEGSTLRSLQPLTNTQVTQIAKALKEKTQSEVPSVVCDNGPNSTRLGFRPLVPVTDGALGRCS